MKSLRPIGGLLLAILVIGAIAAIVSTQQPRRAYAPPITLAVADGSLQGSITPGAADTAGTSAAAVGMLPTDRMPAGQVTDPAVASAQDWLVQQSPAGAQIPSLTGNSDAASALADTATPQVASIPQPTPTLAPAPTPSPAPSPTVAHPDPALAALELYVHLPPDAAAKQPLRVLLALHGMGGNGAQFAENLAAVCDRNGWVLVAPTLPYVKDYRDPQQLREEDLYLGHSLHAMLAGLPKRLGLKLRQHTLVVGFSRGAQLGHRFALFHPDMVEALALISAGSYTMPNADSVAAKQDAFPLGVADLPRYLGGPVDWKDFKRLSFWIAVGEKDNRTGEVARAFDPYGTTRVDRARTFGTALQSMGIDVQVVVFPNADHEVTVEMRNRALDFLRNDELADRWND